MPPPPSLHLTGPHPLSPQSFALPGWDQGMSREAVRAVMDMFNPAGVSSTVASVWVTLGGDRTPPPPGLSCFRPRWPTA